MTLNRAKTVLILAFLGLNLFLCYHLLGDRLQRSAWGQTSGKQWRQVEEQLAQNGYLLLAKVDRAARKSAFLTVSPAAVSEIMLRKYFEVPPEPSIDAGGVLLYVSPRAQLRVYPGGPLRIELTPGDPLGDAVADEAAAASRGERYVREKGLTTAGLRYDHATHSGPRMTLHYRQIHEGMILFNGYLDVVMENNRIVAMEIYLLDPETPPQNREMEVIPASRALSRLIEVLGPVSPPRRIVKADLGFYSREYDAERWEMPPVWHFLFDDGEGCFINAFTGNREPEISN